MLSVVVVVCAKIHHLEVLCKYFASIFTKKYLFRQNTNMSLGNRIKKLSDDKGVSNYQVAKGTGIAQSTLSRLMTNSTSKLNDSNLELLAKYFDVSVDYLRTGNEDLRDKSAKSVSEPSINFQAKCVRCSDFEQRVIELKETIEAQREAIDAQKETIDAQKLVIGMQQDIIDKLQKDI